MDNLLPIDLSARDVTVAICTFRRESVFETLDTIAKQADVDRYDVTVIVIDNDDTNMLGPKVEAFAESYTFPLRYVHAPSRNISIARNAALDNVQTSWLLFIDDDELAEPHWVANIMAVRETAEVIIGQCQAVYGPDLSDWVKRCDFHSTRLGDRTDTAYAGNALINMGFVRQHAFRFRLALGRTGGEDTIFFRELTEAGGRIRYAPDAIVLEPVPEGRASMRWIRIRKFRAGQTHGLVTRDFDPETFKGLWATAGIKALVSTFMAGITLPGTIASRKWWARACMHAGAFSYRLRPTIYEEYG